MEKEFFIKSITEQFLVIANGVSGIGVHLGRGEDDIFLARYPENDENIKQDYEKKNQITEEYFNSCIAVYDKALAELKQFAVVEDENRLSLKKFDSNEKTSRILRLAIHEILNIATDAIIAA